MRPVTLAYQVRRFQTSSNQFSTRRRELSVVLTDFAEIDYSDAASCQNLDAVEPLVELAMAQAWNEFKDPSIVNSGGTKDYLDKSDPYCSGASLRHTISPIPRANGIKFARVGTMSLS
jgi:hypothetical protein